MKDILESVKFMIEIANDDSHGYDQTHRYGPDYDCSSLVAKALIVGGFDVSQTSTTRDLAPQLRNNGFVDCVRPWKAGDIHLKVGKHVAMSISENQIAHASINENGQISGGLTGDQTGKEICIRDYYEYTGGWDMHLRYEDVYLYKVVSDVIAGKYGNGKERIQNIQKLGLDYNIVQTLVNEKLGVIKVDKTIDKEFDSRWEIVMINPDDVQDLGISLYVASAIAGNFWHESTLNPGIWESLSTGNWTDLGKGYGLGQWTNTGGNRQGRLYQLHRYLINEQWKIDDGYGQLSFMLYEDYWTKRTDYDQFSNLTDFLTSDSEDIEMLTHAWNLCWEGIHDASWDARVDYAKRCFEYVQEHYDDPNITDWITGNRYLSDNERLNNAVLLCRFLSDGIIYKKKKGMPVWMKIRYHY